jgi:alkylhydroperoxidase family enzyme
MDNEGEVSTDDSTSNFTAAERSELALAISMINLWNRLAKALNWPVSA